MQGNKYAVGKKHTYRFRPSVVISKRLVRLIDTNNCPFELTWRSGGRTGIATNDPLIADDWVTRAQAANFKVRNGTPQRITKIQKPPVGERRQRCAECDCGDGPCNWIRPTVDELDVGGDTLTKIQKPEEPPWDEI